MSCLNIDIYSKPVSTLNLSGGQGGRTQYPDYNARSTNLIQPKDGNSLGFDSSRHRSGRNPVIHILFEIWFVQPT